MSRRRKKKKKRRIIDKERLKKKEQREKRNEVLFLSGTTLLFILLLSIPIYRNITSKEHVHIPLLLCIFVLVFLILTIRSIYRWVK